jgi:hypothetical protein
VPNKEKMVKVQQERKEGSKMEEKESACHM